MGVEGAIWPKGHWQFPEKLNSSDHLLVKIRHKNNDQLPNKKIISTQVGKKRQRHSQVKFIRNAMKGKSYNFLKVWHENYFN